MRERMRLISCVMAAGMLLLLSGCWEDVEPGWVGIRKTPGGLEKTMLQPGSHSCWGRDKMIVVESVEQTVSEQLSILCSDDLNFKCDVKIRSRLKTMTAEELVELLRLQGSKVQWNGDVGSLSYKSIYDTYISPEARSISRQVISKYQTTQIREAREAIQKSITESLLVALKKVPIEITSVVTSNFDYPDVITQAVEKKRQKEIEIDEEKAKQAMELLKAQNRMRIAEEMKKVRAAEAEAEAVYNRILAESITAEYLELRRRENEELLYQQVGGGDLVVIYPEGSSMSPLINIPASKKTSEKATPVPMPTKKKPPLPAPKR